MPCLIPSDKAAIASGWSPVGLKEEDNSNAIVIDESTYCLRHDNPKNQVEQDAKSGKEHR